MKIRNRLAALAVMALTAALMIPPASAGTVLTIRIGADVPKGFSARMYAPPIDGVPTIQVHADDVVNFQGGVGLLPDGVGPYEFYSENGGGLDRPFSFFHSDPDQDLVEPFPSEADYKFNDAFFGVVDCGDTAANPCVFDGNGSDIFNPGDRESFDGNLFVELDADPGDVLWATGAIAPSKHTTMRIEIVPGGENVTTQGEVDAAFDHLHQLDVDTARALDAKLSKKATFHKVNGKRIYDAYAGYDTEVLALFAMYPKKIVLKKGDTVRWHFDQLGIEFHSAVFPFEQGQEIAANGFLPVCDPDGPGEGPDNFTVDFETFTCEPGTGDLEIDLTLPMTAESGNGKFNGTDHENSGLRSQNAPSVPGFAGGGDPWDLRFNSTSGPKGFKYVCGFHGAEMKGTVVVK